MGIGAILNRFEPAAIKRMFNNAKMVSEYSGKSLLYVLTDMSKCILFDNVGYMEYNFFHFIDKTPEQRKTYITFNDSQEIFRRLNERAYFDIFDNKLIFNEHFKKYLGREFIDAAHCSDEEFEKYLKGKKKIYCKPKDSCSGKGIYRSFDIDENTDTKQLHRFMIDNDLFCEDTIEQNKEMSKLNETSINTVRITTLLWDNKSYFMYALLRCGLTGMQVDNVASGGIYTVLSKDGKVVNPFWSDKTLKTYEKHPTNDFQLLGFEVPMFKQAVDMCLEAAFVEPHMKYIGWDVAITPNGPVLVEGNQLPGYDMPQNCFANNSQIGMKPEFEKIIGKI